MAVAGNNDLPCPGNAAAREECLESEQLVRSVGAERQAELSQSSSRAIQRAAICRMLCETLEGAFIIPARRS